MAEAVTGGAAAGGVRALRLTAFCAAATALAVGAHLAGGGMPPDAVATALASLLAAAAGWVLTRRRRGLLDILAVLAAVQVVTHELFATAPTASLPGMPMAGMPMGGAGGAVMLAAHALAVAVTAVLLARGERLVHDLTAVLAWVRGGAHRLRHGDAVPAVPVPGVLRGPVVAVRPQLSVLVVRHIVERRGPPHPVW